MRKTNRAAMVLALVLVCALVCLPFPVHAQASDLWSDAANRATDYALRDDAAKRIEIADAAQLALFAHEVNQGTSFAGYTVVLTQDIDLSGHFWYPIGDARDTDSYHWENPQYAFRGTFDGQNHTISNMQIVIGEDGYPYRQIGLFGCTMAAEIKNVCIYDASIQGTGTGDGLNIGALCGGAYGTVVRNCVVKNISIEAQISSDSIFAGGCVGFTYWGGSGRRSAVENCAASDITIQTKAPGSWNYVGGLIGYDNGCETVENCCVLQFSAQEDNTASDYRAGDLVGFANIAKYRYNYYDGQTPFGKVLHATVEQDKISHVVDGALDNSVTIGSQTYDTLLEALNAWVEQKGDEVFQQWSCANGFLPHAWENEFTVDVKPTDTADGSMSIHCSNCDAKKDVTVLPMIAIIEGANSVWQIGQNQEGLSFTSTAAFADFEQVLVDGQLLDAHNYDVEQGSTIVTLHADYLNGLKPGEHTFAIVSDSVAARTQFTVKSSDVQVPATGDTAMFLPMVCAMFVLTGIGAAGVFVSRKKAQ
jgi:hypothetical protein